MFNVDHITPAMCDTHSTLQEVNPETERRIRRCLTAYRGHYSGLFGDVLQNPVYQSPDSAEGRFIVYRDLTTKLGVREQDGAYVLSGTHCDLVLIHQTDTDVSACHVYYLVSAFDPDDATAYIFHGSRPVTLMATAKNNAVISRMRKDRTVCVTCYWKS